MFASSPVDVLHWQAAVLACDALTPAEKLCAAALAGRINSKTAAAWPSLQTIARDCRLSVEVAKRAMRKLRRLGRIVVEPPTGNRASNTYRAVLPGVCTDPCGGSVETPKRAIEQAKIPPSPAAGEPVEIAAEPSPAAAIAPQPAAEPAPLPEVPAAAEAPQKPADAALDPDDFGLVIGYINAILGTNHPTRPARGDRGHRHIMALLRRGHGVADLQAVFDYCRTTWSSPRLLTPSAVFRPDTFAEKLQAAGASVKVHRGAAHRLFEPEQEAPRADPATARAGLRGLREALAGRFAA
ncbi:hypothetical protein [Thiohalocapsa marina]|uniref:hypothetical protein n=1 Tax=Thiohalocapsa marina TaxID=424902 RepID=UPI0036DB3F65